MYYTNAQGTAWYRIVEVKFEVALIGLLLADAA